jgi:Autoinducer synthetase.
MQSVSNGPASPKESAFLNKAELTLKMIDYRKITTSKEIEDVQRLRFEAYSRENNVFSDKKFFRSDKFDNERNAEVFGLYIENRIAASLRIHRVTAETPQTPSAIYFPEFFASRLARGDSFLEPTRFVISDEFARRFPLLHFMTMRVCFMATVHYGMPFILCSVRGEHGSYYKRFFGMEAEVVGKMVPTIAIPADLYVGSVAEKLPLVEQRLPFMRSTEEERAALFEESFEQPRFRLVAGMR